MERKEWKQLEFPYLSDSRNGFDRKGNYRAKRLFKEDEEGKWCAPLAAERIPIKNY